MYSYDDIKTYIAATLLYMLTVKPHAWGVARIHISVDPPCADQQGPYSGLSRTDLRSHQYSVTHTPSIGGTVLLRTTWQHTREMHKLAQTYQF